MKIFNKQKAISIMIILSVFLIFFSGCANKESVEAYLEGQKYGFWGSLWHREIT